MQRRSPLDGDETPTRESVNVFDDEFAVDDLDGLADGFRPGQSHDREGNLRQDQDDNAGYSISAFRAVAPATFAELSRSSTRKSQSHENPFASPEDEPEPPLRRTPSGNFAPLPHRSISSASSRRFAGTNSPRVGASGPSHPYGMYPQGTVTRTPSTATSSTARPRRRSASGAGPQHPYEMYPQGVDDGVEDEHESAQSHVPIGFMGLGQSYQRQRGPDGEEQDIIGAYGHTEQLPPYSRYPEDGPEKAPLLVPDPPSALHSRAPVLGTDPGMELMHAQLQPSPQSMTDQSDLQRQPSRSSRSSATLLGGGSPTDSLSSEKRWREKSWKEKKKTRLCGIPFYWFLLASGLLVFVGAVMGGIFGGYVEGQRKAENTISQAHSSSLYDVSLIATPSATSPPTGTFSLDLGMPQATQAECLTIPEQRATWSCDLAYGGDVAINISFLGGGDNAGAFLYNPEPSDSNSLTYGTQASSMTTSFSPFLLVMDNEDPEDGKAFYFQTQYDKLVVVSGDALSYDGSTKKLTRSPFEVPKAWFGEAQVARPGDKPWFCYWNNTFVEGFIYTQMRAATPTTSSTITPAPSSQPTSTGDDGGYYSSTSTSSWPPWTWLTAAPTDTITKTFTMPTTTCTYAGVASELPYWLHHNYPNWNASEYGGSGSDNSKRDDDGDDYPPMYPYLVKIEERRVPGSPRPYCVQYQVLDNGLWNPTGNSEGQQIRIELSETDPPFGGYRQPGSRKARLKRDGGGGCHCQWMSGQ